MVNVDLYSASSQKSLYNRRNKNSKKRLYQTHNYGTIILYKDCGCLRTVGIKLQKIIYRKLIKISD